MARRISSNSRKQEHAAAEELFSRDPKSLRQDVGDQLGWRPSAQWCRLPALFELHQKRRGGEAARLAGFRAGELIQSRSPPRSLPLDA